MYPDCLFSPEALPTLPRCTFCARVPSGVVSKPVEFFGKVYACILCAIDDEKNYTPFLEWKVDHGVTEEILNARVRCAFTHCLADVQLRDLDEHLEKHAMGDAFSQSSSTYPMEKCEECKKHIIQGMTLHDTAIFVFDESILDMPIKDMVKLRKDPCHKRLYVCDVNGNMIELLESSDDNGVIHPSSDATVRSLWKNEMFSGYVHIVYDYAQETEVRHLRPKWMTVQNLRVYTKPTEPTEPTEPMEPREPSEPVEMTKTTEATEPTVPMVPVVPKELSTFSKMFTPEALKDLPVCIYCGEVPVCAMSTKDLQYACRYCSIVNDSTPKRWTEDDIARCKIRDAPVRCSNTQCLADLRLRYLDAHLKRHEREHDGTTHHRYHYYPQRCETCNDYVVHPKHNVAVFYINDPCNVLHMDVDTIMLRRVSMCKTHLLVHDAHGNIVEIKEGANRGMVYSASRTTVETLLLPPKKAAFPNIFSWGDKWYTITRVRSKAVPATVCISNGTNVGFLTNNMVIKKDTKPVTFRVRNDSGDLVCKMTAYHRKNLRLPEENETFLLVGISPDTTVGQMTCRRSSSSQAVIFFVHGGTKTVFEIASNE